MTIETLDKKGFIGRYGDSHPFLDGNTQTVLVGTLPELQDHLEGNGYVSSILPTDNGKDSEMSYIKSSDDYGKMAVNAIRGAVEDPLDMISQAGRISDDLGLGETNDNYTPSIVRQLAGSNPFGKREHVRIYEINDGKYAAEIHTDPGFDNPLGSIWEGDIIGAFKCVFDAAYYHSGMKEKVDSYKDGAITAIGRAVNDFLNPGEKLKPAEAVA